jgi:proteasome accessory factor B
LDKLERLLNLISALLETTRPLTADELRTRVPGYPDNKTAFRRAFERDKEDLRDMGIPLVLETIAGVDPPLEGYRIDREQYYLRDPGFDPDELAALHLAMNAVRLEGLDVNDGLWRLGGVVQPAGEPAPDAGAFASLPGDTNLAPLFQACADRRTASFDYNGEHRRVDAHRVGYQRGHWYLRGHDHDRAGERSFRLDRIAGAVEIGAPGSATHPAAARSGLPDDPWRLGEGPEELARLLVDADQLAWAGHQLGDATVVEQRDDGSAVLEVAVTNWPAFRTFVLGFLDHAELLAPAERRAELLAWLHEVAS